VFAAGTRTAGQALADFASRAGTDVSAADSDATSMDEQLADMDVLRDSISAVDTDEEAIRLIEFQTAYRAAARVLSVSDEMLRTLLSVGS
jgi:flagellar hook-associated protein 1 FlgK